MAISKEDVLEYISGLSVLELSALVKDFEEKFFEGCMPFEEMARRGKQTLLFGPMKPVGLTKPDGTNLLQPCRGTRLD